MKPILLLPLLFLVSELVSASLHTVRVFQSSENRVIDDYLAKSRAKFDLIAYEVDAHQQGEAALTQAVEDVIQGTVTEYNYEARYREGLQTVLQTPLWYRIQAQFIEANQTYAMTKRLGIQKVPAIVFNDAFVVYGVNSLSDAIRLFESRRAK